MDVAIADMYAGRLVFELYMDAAPKTSLNFLTICRTKPVVGEEVDENTDSLTYAKSPFHRIIPGFMVQGGHIPHPFSFMDTTIFGKDFDDETFCGKAGVHRGFGTLAMASHQRNKNNTEFYVCLGDTPWLDGRHVVFGMLLEGGEVLRKMEELGSSDGTPLMKIHITRTGEITDTFRKQQRKKARRS